MDEVNEEEVGYYLDMISCMVCLLFGATFPDKDYQKSFIEAWEQRAEQRGVDSEIIKHVSEHFYISMDALKHESKP